MRIAIDIDGVCANSFVDLGISAEEICAYDFSDQPKDVKARIFKAFDTEDYWKTLKLMPGAQQGVLALAAMGHEIVFVTSPWMKTAHNWVSLRKEWIEKNFGQFKIIYTEHKELVSADILLDDKLETCLRTQEAWMKRQRGERVPRPYVMFKYGYNQGSHLKTFESWDEVVAHFKEPFA